MHRKRVIWLNLGKGSASEKSYLVKGRPGDFEFHVLAKQVSGEWLGGVNCPSSPALGADGEDQRHSYVEEVTCSPG